MLLCRVTRVLNSISRKVLECWPEARWKRLQEHLFDVSEFVRKVQGAFATWYNRTFNRKGHLWGDRFKSTLLGGPEAVLDAALYVELNAVRAGLVECRTVPKLGRASGDPTVVA